MLVNAAAAASNRFIPKKQLSESAKPIAAINLSAIHRKGSAASKAEPETTESSQLLPVATSLEVEPSAIEESVSKTPLLCVVIDQVMDPQNLGAILRHCLFFGVDAVIMCDRNCAPVSPVACKVPNIFVNVWLMSNCLRLILPDFPLFISVFRCLYIANKISNETH